MKRAPGPELRRFLGAYGPDVARIALRLRAFVLDQALLANEFVYDAYNAVAMGYSFTERPSEAFCHIAVYPRWVNLGFNRGSQIADPEGLLQGEGRSIRHIRIETLEDLRRPFVGRFLRAAIQAAQKGDAADAERRPAPRPIVRAVYETKRRPKKPARRKGESA